MTTSTMPQPDILLRLNKQGVIRGVTLSDRMAQSDAAGLVGKSWEETVGDVGGSKIRAMLEQALTEGVSAFRQINQHFPDGNALPIEFTAVHLGEHAGMIAIGRNLQTVAELQSRLVAAQQAIERDYWKFREIETRYRMLFDTSGEAVVVVRGTSLSIIEANPAAIRALGAAPVENDFLFLLPAVERAPVRAMLERVRDSGRAPGVIVHLGDGADPWMLRASPMKADSGPAFLLQLSPVGTAEPIGRAQPPLDIESMVDAMPDGFVVMDKDGVILRANQAFLDLVQVGSRSLLIGERLGRWLGRPGADLTVLLANLAQYGVIRLFATTIHGELGAEADVEISAASRIERDQRLHMVLVRDVGTRLPMARPAASRSMLQHATIRPIGSAPLRELVSDTTEVIERHYIEAALDLTKGNRKAAAELLGLSRQALYSKLDRYGLNGDDPASS
jgi:transcriptional regulator PpsR